jgi:hypothetical protein
LERVIADLETAKQKIKSLQVAVTILLAGFGSLVVGMATRAAGATVSVALGSAASVFSAGVVASVAILVFIYR